MLCTLFTCHQSLQPYKTSQGSYSAWNHHTRGGSYQVTYIQRLICRYAQCIWHCLLTIPPSPRTGYYALVTIYTICYSHQNQLSNFVTLIIFKKQNQTRLGLEFNPWNSCYALSCHLECRFNLINFSIMGSVKKAFKGYLNNILQ